MQSGDSQSQTIAFGNGWLLAYGDGDTAKWWNARTGELAATILLASHPLHTGPDIYSVVWATASPDGRLLVTEGGDRAVHMQDAATGRLLQTLPGGAGPFVFSPDGTLLAGLAADTKAPQEMTGPVKVWSRTGQVVRSLAVEGDSVATGLQFFPDGRRLLASTVARRAPSVSGIQVWDIATGRLLRRFSTSEDMYLLGVLADNKTALVVTRRSDRHQEVQVWDTETGDRRILLKWDGFQFSARTPEFHFVPSRQMLVVGLPGIHTISQTDTGLAYRPTFQVQVWHLPTDRPQRSFFLPELYSGGFAVSPDGQTLATSIASQKTQTENFQLWNLATGTPGRLLKRDDLRTELGYFSFSSDSRFLVDQAGGAPWFWDVASGKQHHARTVMAAAARTLACSPHGRLFAFGIDSGAELWDVRRNRFRPPLRENYRPSALAFSADERLLAVGGAGGSVSVWDLAAEAQTWQSLELKERGSSLLLSEFGDLWTTGLAFSPDGRTLVSGSTIDGSSSLRVWQAETGRLQRSWGAGPPASGVAVSPDGRLIADGFGTPASPQGGVELWDAATGRRHALAKGPGWGNPVAFSPDGRLLAGAETAPDRITLWDTRTGQRRRSLRGRVGHVNSLCFSGDGRQMATGSEDGIFALWDVRGGRLRRTWAGGTGRGNAVAFSANGRDLVGAGRDGAYRFWSSDTGRLLATLRFFYPVPVNREKTQVLWLIQTGDGHYDAAPGADQFFRWRIGDAMRPASAYAKRFHQPNLVQKALQGL